MTSYECILTSLPTISIDSPLPISLNDLNAFLQENLSEKDQQQIKLLQTSAADKIFQDQVAILQDNISIQPLWWDELSTNLSTQDMLIHVLYLYQQGELAFQKNTFHSNDTPNLPKPCSLIRKWFAFNQNINNVLVATICLRHAINPLNNIIGIGEIADTLRKTTTNKHFGLQGVYDIIDNILVVADIENLYDREKAIDKLKFNWIDDQIRFSYFSLSNILAYYLKVIILNRWTQLNIERGEKIFKDIVNDMKSGINLDV